MIDKFKILISAYRGITPEQWRLTGNQLHTLCLVAAGFEWGAHATIAASILTGIGEVVKFCYKMAKKKRGKVNVKKVG